MLQYCLLILDTKLLVYACRRDEEESKLPENIPKEKNTGFSRFIMGFSYNGFSCPHVIFNILHRSHTSKRDTAIYVKSCKYFNLLFFQIRIIPIN